MIVGVQGLGQVGLRIGESGVGPEWRLSNVLFNLSDPFFVVLIPGWTPLFSCWATLI